MPPSLYQRLLIAADQQGKTLSAIASDLLDRALVVHEEAQWKRIYQGLQKLKGSGPAGITDASSTIHETLYGERGAWRGHSE